MRLGRIVDGLLFDLRTALSVTSSSTDIGAGMPGIGSEADDLDQSVLFGADGGFGALLLAFFLASDAFSAAARA